MATTDPLQPASAPDRTLVLVVEDEWLVRQGVVGELRAAGFAIVDCASGESALILLQQGQRADVLVTDIQLAGALTGWDVAEAYRGAFPQIPVIYASAAQQQNPRRVADSLFFAKPYQATEIRQACIAAASR